MSLGKRIKAARERIDGLTQAKLADQLGISDKAVSGWERDEAKPDTDKYPDLVRALKVTYYYLHEGGELPEPDDLAVLLDSLPPNIHGTALRMIRALAEKPEVAA